MKTDEDLEVSYRLSLLEEEIGQLKADKAELVEVLKPFMEGTEWVTGEHFAMARALIAKHA